MKKWNEHRFKLESCPNDEKRVEQKNELRLNLDGVPMIGNKMDEVETYAEPRMVSQRREIKGTNN